MLSTRTPHVCASVSRCQTNRKQIDSCWRIARHLSLQFWLVCVCRSHDSSDACPFAWEMKKMRSNAHWSRQKPAIRTHVAWKITQRWVSATVPTTASRTMMISFSEIGYMRSAHTHSLNTPEINRLATVERKHQLIYYNNKLVCKRAVDKCTTKKKICRFFISIFFAGKRTVWHEV